MISTISHLASASESGWLPEQMHIGKLAENGEGNFIVAKRQMGKLTLEWEEMLGEDTALQAV